MKTLLAVAALTLLSGCWGAVIIRYPDETGRYEVRPTSGHPGTGMGALHPDSAQQAMDDRRQWLYEKMNKACGDAGFRTLGEAPSGSMWLIEFDCQTGDADAGTQGAKP